MKCFSPAGMAVKGFFGGPGWNGPYSLRDGGSDSGGGRSGWIQPQTVGNPDGARSGGGAWARGGANINGPDQGGGGGSSGLTWTQRAGVPGGSTPLTPNSAANGVVIMGDGANGLIYQSTDGGITFTQQASGVGSVTRAAYCGSNVWIMGANNSNYFLSADNGATWSGPHAMPGGFGVQTLIFSASDGAGNVVVLGDSTGAGNYAISSDHGTTFTVPNTYNNNGWQAIIWDGSEFVGLAVAALAPHQTVVAVSALGSSWAQAILVASNVPNLNSGLSRNGSSGLYLVGANLNDANPFVRTATTPFGLQGASNVDTGLNVGSGLRYTLVANNLYWAFDTSGEVASSPDGATWTLGTLNLPGGNSATGAAYDATHNSYVATSGNGGIATFP